MAVDLIRVKVTKKHIHKGVPQSPCSCPIALAVRELCPDEVVNVGTKYIAVGGIRYQTPSVATQFIRRFDTLRTRRNLDGFTFDLRKA